MASKDRHLKRIMDAWKTALDHLDATEPQMRELIESHLMDVDSEDNTKKNLGKKSVDDLMMQIEAVRAPAIRKAFRHLRDNLPSHHDLQPR